MISRYDSVTKDGDLNWQDQLNGKNKPFFDLCDGIFVNYTWKVCISNNRLTFLMFKKLHFKYFP